MRVQQCGTRPLTIGARVCMGKKKIIIIIPLIKRTRRSVGTVRIFSTCRYTHTHTHRADRYYIRVFMYAYISTF